ncbi:MAG: HAD family hydrolase [Dissulfurispiraceae bacterium]
MKLALFDFDGTITRKDSFADFFLHTVGGIRFSLGFLVMSPVIALYKLGVIANDKAKEMVLSHFFKGWNINEFKETAQHYSNERLPGLVRKEAMERLLWHKEQGHVVVVISASIECWLEGWCSMYGVDLIATKLECKDGKLTGRFSTENCYGGEKVRRLREKYVPEAFDYIYAYGDSQGDREMLQLADEPYYQTFEATR